MPHTSAAKARGKRLGRAADPANAIKRVRVVSKAQAAQFAAVLPIIRISKRLATRCHRR
jgi:hypothetical protein